jgi:D-glycero-alpha-D-manno-heptose-7-phosphate kinase
MEFGPGDRVLVNPLRVKNWVLCELESSLLLFHSGVSRQSAAIISQQLENITRKNALALDGLRAMKVSAIEMKESLLRGEIDRFAAAMNHSWVSKMSTAERIVTPTLQHAYDAAMEAGASAAKISGAGGGGFLMILVDPDLRMQVLRALEGLEGQIFPCHFTKRGVEGWTL